MTICMHKNKCMHEFTQSGGPKILCSLDWWGGGLQNPVWGEGVTKSACCVKAIFITQPHR